MGIAQKQIKVEIKFLKIKEAESICDNYVSGVHLLCTDVQYLTQKYASLFLLEADVRL